MFAGNRSVNIDRFITWNCGCCLGDEILFQGIVPAIDDCEALLIHQSLHTFRINPPTIDGHSMIRPAYGHDQYDEATRLGNPFQLIDP